MHRRSAGTVRLRWAPLALAACGPAGAQMTMPMPSEPAASTAASPRDSQAKPAADRGDAGEAMPGMAHVMADMPGMAHAMPAMLGPFGMNRESSGTSWQPDSSPMYGAMLHAGAWAGMAEGYATLVGDDQGGPRGARQTFVESMAMVMANRPIGVRGRLGLRAMLSLDPAMGPRGYPLLFATGETADGRTELVDRQHPHDLLMELAASYAHDLGGGRALFVYAGLPGEPALGPPTFMHRISGTDDPEAPIGHHWFDSTHITWGVVTVGYSGRTWKLEASAFKGREPDQHRWDVEAPRLDSWSVRAFWNPTANLSLQASTGHLHSPEQLHPEQDEQRTTASASWNLPLGPGANLAATVAWSLKDERPGPALNGWLAEASWRFADRNTLYGRAEREDEAELFGEGSPLHDTVIPVNKLSLGYQYELPVARLVRIAFGALASTYAYPRRLDSDYGGDGVKSVMVYSRLSFGDRRIR